MSETIKGLVSALSIRYMQNKKGQQRVESQVADTRKGLEVRGKTNYQLKSGQIGLRVRQVTQELNKGCLEGKFGDVLF